MKPARRLAVKKETLAELRTDELTQVAGASGWSCICPNTPRCPSDWFISLCGCFTNYCSIDVC